jgi:hypothetical protein
MRAIKEKELLIYLLLISLVLLLVPQLVRLPVGLDVIVGQQTYHHAILAENLVESGFPLIKLFENYSPYHYLVAFLGSFLSIGLATKIISIFLGLLTTFLFFLLLAEFGIGKNKRFLIILLFVMSPIFIYSFTFANPYSLALALSFLGVYFFLKNKNIYLALSVISFVLVSLFDSFNIFLCLFFLFVYSYKVKEKKNWFFTILLFAAIIIFTIPKPFFTSYGYVKASFFTEFISGLGGLIGFGVFQIFLFFIGIFSSWKKEYWHFPSYFAIIVLFFLSVFLGPVFNIYLSIIVSVFAGIGFFKLIKIKWQLTAIRDLTILIIICGLLFSSASFINRIAVFPPSKTEVDSLLYLQNYSVSGERVLSHYSNSYLIEYYSDRDAILDPLDLKYQQDLINDTEAIFHSTLLKDAMDLLHQHKVRYVWVNKPMKQGLIWDKEGEELLFLFRNKQDFKKVYNSTEVQIWKVFK